MKRFNQAVSGLVSTRTVTPITDGVRWPWINRAMLYDRHEIVPLQAQYRSPGLLVCYRDCSKDRFAQGCDRRWLPRLLGRTIQIWISTFRTLFVTKDIGSRSETRFCREEKRLLENVDRYGKN